MHYSATGSRPPANRNPFIRSVVLSILYKGARRQQRWVAVPTFEAANLLPPICLIPAVAVLISVRELRRLLGTIETLRPGGTADQIRQMMDGIED